MTMERSFPNLERSMLAWGVRWRVQEECYGNWVGRMWGMHLFWGELWCFIGWLWFMCCGQGLRCRFCREAYGRYTIVFAVRRVCCCERTSLQNYLVISWHLTFKSTSCPWSVPWNTPSEFDFTWSRSMNRLYEVTTVTKTWGTLWQMQYQSLLKQKIVSGAKRNFACKDSETS